MIVMLPTALKGGRGEAMNREKLNKIDATKQLLPDPGPEVVGELIAELRVAQEHLEMAWTVIANAGVPQGDWNSMTPEWRAAAEKWRDVWYKMVPQVQGKP